MNPQQTSTYPDRRTRARRAFAARLVTFGGEPPDRHEPTPPEAALDAALSVRHVHFGASHPQRAFE